MKKIIGIYKITSPTGNIYIGSSVNVRNRFQQYKCNLAISQVALNRSFVKHGYDSHKFEIIEECCIGSLFERERYWGIYFDVTGKNGLNCRIPSAGEKKQLISDELRSKFSIIAKNRKYSNETIKKFRDAKIGKYNGQKTKNSVLILDTSTGIYYETLYEAADARCINRSTLSSKINLIGHYKKNNTSLIRA